MIFTLGSINQPLEPSCQIRKTLSSRFLSVIRAVTMMISCRVVGGFLRSRFSREALLVYETGGCERDCILQQRKSGLKTYHWRGILTLAFLIASCMQIWTCRQRENIHIRRSDTQPVIHFNRNTFSSPKSHVQRRLLFECKNKIRNSFSFKCIYRYF